MKKALTFLLILAISAAALSGCKNSKDPGSTTTTKAGDVTTPGTTGIKSPEEVFSDILAHRDNMRYIFTTQSDESMISIKIVQEMRVCGDVIYSRATTDMLGESETEENYYVKTDTGARFYFLNNGVWYDMSVSGEEFDALLDFESEGSDWVFSSGHYGEYDPETRRYPLTEYSFGVDEDLLGEDTYFQEGWLEIGDGSYTIHLTLTVEGQPMTSDMLFTDFGKTEVTLPESTSYTGPDGGIPAKAPRPEEIAGMITDSDSISVSRWDGSEEDFFWMEYIEREGENYSVNRSSEEEERSWMLEKTDGGYALYLGEDLYGEDGGYLGTAWTKSDLSADQLKDYLPSFDSLTGLLKSDLYEEYDPSTGLYVMRDGVSAEFETYGKVSGVSIQISESSLYGLAVTVTVPVRMNGGDGTVEITVSDMDSTYIFFPDVDDGSFDAAEKLPDYETLSGLDKLRSVLELVQTVDGMGIEYSAEMALTEERDGNRMKVTDSSQIHFTDESESIPEQTGIYYIVTESDRTLAYFEDMDEGWEGMALDPASDVGETLLHSLRRLFLADLYGEPDSSGKRAMKDGQSVRIAGYGILSEVTFVSGDGECSFSGLVKDAGSEGRFTLTFSDYGAVNVTLPDSLPTVK